MSACGQFRCRDCRRLDLFLHCATQPVIESSQKIQTAPLIIDFESIENHLKNLNISKFTNHWNQVRNLDFFELYFHYSVFLDTRFWSSWKRIKLVPSKKRDWKIRRNLWLIRKYVYDSPNCEVDSFSFPSDWLLRNYHEKRRLFRYFFWARCWKLSNELLSRFDTRQKIR